MRQYVDPEWIAKLMPVEREFVARQLGYKFISGQMVGSKELYEDMARRLHVGKLIEYIGPEYYLALKDQDGVPVRPYQVCLALWQGLTWKWFGNRPHHEQMTEYRGYW